MQTARSFALRGISCLCAVWLGTATAGAMDSGAPKSKVDDITDKYGDVSVKDPYRWLEKAGDPSVHQWSLEQDKRTRSYLDKLPYRKQMYDRLFAQISATSSSYYDLLPAGGKLFAMFNQPPKQQPMIAVMDKDADPAHARVVVDPNKINAKGTTAIDWFQPSPDGKMVAASMSDNGSEDGSVHIFSVDTGKQIDKVIPLVQYPTGGGSLAWRADSKGFWYTRYPGPEDAKDRQHFYQQVYFHKLGDDPSKDSYVMGKDFPKVAEIALDAKQNHKYVMVSVANGDGGEFSHFVLDEQNKARQLSHFDDKIVAAALGPDDSVYLVSRQDAPRGKLLRLSVDNLDLAQAKVLVPQSEHVIQPGGEFGGSPIIVTKDSIYLREIAGGPSRVDIFDHDGKHKGSLALPGVAAVDEVVPLSDSSLLYSVKTYLAPPCFQRYDESTKKSAVTKLLQTSPVKFKDTEVVREFATSKDGTKIPLNIVKRKDCKLDGSNPLLLNGYGGYSVNMTPKFLGAPTRLWLDAGGVYVIANLRGGGEFGEEWHAKGSLTNKQNVFDDFTAAANYLVEHKYTNHKKMAAIGGSNGGLLMGAVFTQHPDLFAAVVSQVGIYDMLRVELDPNGAFNTTEFGTVKNPDHFKALYAYSPYHHVTPDTKYPAIFMATGETDGRVNPMHSRKMIAALQAATSSGKPIYLSINAHAGHGIGSSLSIKTAQTADLYAFIFDQLGMKYPAK